MSSILFHVVMVLGCSASNQVKNKYLDSRVISSASVTEVFLHFNIVITEKKQPQSELSPIIIDEWHQIAYNSTWKCVLENIRCCYLDYNFINELNAGCLKWRMSASVSSSIQPYSKWMNEIEAAFIVKLLSHCVLEYIDIVFWNLRSLDSTTRWPTQMIRRLQNSWNNILAGWIHHRSLRSTSKMKWICWIFVSSLFVSFVVLMWHLIYKFSILTAHTWDTTWPTSRKLGVVSAVSFDNSNNVVVFHRADHAWDSNTFDQNNVYRQRDRGPVPVNAIIAFNRNTGAVAYEWGKDLFYMPHGLTVDHHDNVWVTDVALHQVMKFNGKNHSIPELVLGTAFQPGNSQTKFCKPTAVAVLANDDFFVADGYCNSRIIKYSKSGDQILSWGRNSFQGVAYAHAPENFFAIPHALTLANDLNLVCVADRENGRVQCFNTMDGTFHSQYHSPVIGDRLFSVAYAPIKGGQLFVVNGPQNTNHPDIKHEVFGFVIEMDTGKVISKFGPNNKPFENPHDIIVTPDGQEVNY